MSTRWVSLEDWQRLCAPDASQRARGAAWKGKPRYAPAGKASALVQVQHRRGRRNKRRPKAAK